jgi:hypothetical protein
MMDSILIATFASIAFKRNFSLECRIPLPIGENGNRESSVGEIVGKSFGKSFNSEAILHHFEYMIDLNRLFKDLNYGRKTKLDYLYYCSKNQTRKTL